MAPPTHPVEPTVSALRAEARTTNERRLLVCTGSHDACLEAADRALDAGEFERENTTLLGSEAALGCEQIQPGHAGKLLGQTRAAVVCDCHDTFRPNALCRVVGAIDGGGIGVVLLPALSSWPAQQDSTARSLAVPPADVESVTGHLRTRVIETLQGHPGIAIVDVDSHRVEDDGLTEPAPALDPPEPERPSSLPVPDAALEACLTRDQTEALAAFAGLQDSGSALVVEADRGRGKSSAAGLASGWLASEGSDVLVSAPSRRNTAELFTRARELLTSLDALGAAAEDPPSHLEAESGGRIRFCSPNEATTLPGDPDLVVVDEAAAVPVARLEALLDAPAVAFLTTVRGYEGAGRSFDVRFRDTLEASQHDVQALHLAEPIRYSSRDPVEPWAFRTFALDARPAVDGLVGTATPDSVQYRALEPETLLAEESLLREAMGLLVTAHYQTEPNATCSGFSTVPTSLCGRSVTTVISFRLRRSLEKAGSLQPAARPSTRANASAGTWCQTC